MYICTHTHTHTQAHTHTHTHTRTHARTQTVCYAAGGVGYHVLEHVALILMIIKRCDPAKIPRFKVF